jgi:hypothetical protein
MNPVRTIRRLACMLAGLAAALAFAAPASAACASLPPHGGGPAGAHTAVRVIATGGMTGWQITPIVAAAAPARRRTSGDRRPDAGHTAARDRKPCLTHAASGLHPPSQQPNRAR